MHKHVLEVVPVCHHEASSLGNAVQRPSPWRRRMREPQGLVIGHQEERHFPLLDTMIQLYRYGAGSPVPFVVPVPGVHPLEAFQLSLPTRGVVQVLLTHPDRNTQNERKATQGNAKQRTQGKQNQRSKYNASKPKPENRVSRARLETTD